MQLLLKQKRGQEKYGVLSLIIMKIYGYTYYVDATTGEIIGGSHSDELINEKILLEDENNLIEK